MIGSCFGESVGGKRCADPWSTFGTQSEHGRCDHAFVSFLSLGHNCDVRTLGATLRGSAVVVGALVGDVIGAIVDASVVDAHNTTGCARNDAV